MTGQVDPFHDELVEKIESHDFDPVKVLQWRNAELDFSSLDALSRSLDKTPERKQLTRVPIATDQQALEFLARNEAGAMATTQKSVELLWQCCGIPDYRDISPAQQLGRTYRSSPCGGLCSGRPSGGERLSRRHHPFMGPGQ